MEMSPSVILSLCIIWSLFTGSISYTEEIVHYRTNRWLNLWDVGPSRSDRPIHRRDTQVPSYTLVKVEQKQSDPLVTISETLGALNTVGNYIVNVTKGVEISNYPPKELPTALYTISKNILGRNVTDSIAPFVRGALPLRQTITSSTQAPSIQQLQQKQQPTEELANRDKELISTCTTIGGGSGKCQDLSDCPQLLLDLTKLKQSLCFKSLLKPGVCCPVDQINNPSIPATSGSTSSGIGGYPTQPPIRPMKHPTPRPIPLYPVTIVTTRPTHIVSSQSNNTNDLEIGTIDNNFIQDSDDCGIRNVGRFRVVGGEEALPGRWPWMAAVFLTSRKGREYWCGASLIGPRHALTAAHCTRDIHGRPYLARQFTVVFGDIDLENDDEPSAPQLHQVKKIHSHEKFSRLGYYNDIAVLELTRPVRRSPYVAPICLPSAYRKELFVGERPTVVGWGSTYYGGKESSTQRQAVLPVWRNEDCDNVYRQWITSNFLCAGYTQGGIDACQGDSGGPLMLKINGRWTQIGIVSFGNKCGLPNYPGVYTRVTEYMDWIKNRIK